MCITEIQVRDIVRKELSDNNQQRDDNLFKFKEELFAHTAKILQHQTTSPSTEKELNGIKQNCFVRGTEMKQMNDRLNEIVEKVDKQDEKLSAILEKLEKKYAPMAAWTIMKWVGAVIGSALLLAALDKLLR